MSATGASLLVRAGRSAEWEPAGPELTIFDDEPFVSLRCEGGRASTIVLESGLEPLEFRDKSARPDGDDKSVLYWSPFNVSSPGKISSVRRLGSFRLRTKKPEHEMMIHIQSRLLFTELEFRALIVDLEGFFHAAAWGVATAHGVGAPLSDTQAEAPGPPRWGRSIEAELHAAHRLLAESLFELCPWRPGAERLPMHPGYMRADDGPEHRLVRVWCEDALRYLRWARDTRERVSVYVKEVRTMPGFVEGLDEPLKTLEGEVTQGLKFASQDLERQVALLATRLGTFRSGSRILLEPSLLRNPHANVLLHALRPATPHLQPAHAIGLTRATLALRLTCDLFERWVAVLFAELLAELGAVPTGRPHINRWPVAPDLPELPQEITWLFRWRDSEVTLHFQIPARRADRPPRPRAGFIPYDDHVASWTAGRAPTGTLVTRRKEVTPDIILVVQTGSGLSFAVGDAICSDLRHGAYKAGDKDGPIGKVDRVAHIYQPYLRVVREGGRLVSPLARSAFVALAGTVGTWSARERCLDRLQDVSGEADELDVHLLWLAPGEPCRSETRSWLKELLERLYRAAGGAAHDDKDSLNPGGRLPDVVPPPDIHPPT